MKSTITVHSKELRLQPLSIPGGFDVISNVFFSILDDGRGIILEDDPEEDPYELYKSTLLWLRHSVRNILIDLEWMPEANPNGSFHITVLHNNDQKWEHPLYEFSSRSKDEIVDKLNQLMADVAAGKFSGK